MDLEEKITKEISKYFQLSDCKNRAYQELQHNSVTAI